LYSSLDGVPFRSSRGNGARARYLGDERNGPTLTCIEYPPHFTHEAHQHDVDEVFYILEGELTIGETRCTPGMAVFIEKDTLYGPERVGPEGAKLLRITGERLRWGNPVVPGGGRPAAAAPVGACFITPSPSGVAVADRVRRRRRGPRSGSLRGRGR